MIDILVQRYRNARAAKRFFRKLLMRGFKSAAQAQRFLSVHGLIRNLFNLGRHRLSSANYRLLGERSFKEWSTATAT